jgi:hypothetical protein
MLTHDHQKLEPTSARFVAGNSKSRKNFNQALAELTNSRRLQIVLGCLMTLYGNCVKGGKEEKHDQNQHENLSSIISSSK